MSGQNHNMHDNLLHQEQERSIFSERQRPDAPAVQSTISYNASFAAPTSIDASENTSGFSTSNNLGAMERVFFHLHSRACHVILAWTSSRIRKLLEHLLLVAAICCFGALLLLHRSFVSKPSGIGSGMELSSLCLNSLPGGFDPASADITHLVILPPPSTTISTNDTIDTCTSVPPMQSRVVWRIPQSQDEAGPQSQPETSSHGQESDSMIASWIANQEHEGALAIHYSYSTTKAYLMLPPKHFILQDHLTVQYVLISPLDTACFGEPFLQFLIWKCYIGPDTILLNWIRSFHLEVSSKKHGNNNAGYVYNPRTKRLWDLETLKNDVDVVTHETQSSKRSWRHQSSTLFAKIAVLVKTSFLFFFCTTLVSFTLRETQERMLDFTRELSRRVQGSLPVSDLIATHLIQNLLFVPIMVGMMFFLIEFYDGDKFLAFSVSSIVWCVEAFSAISLRSSQGLLYFPKFFFLLFLLFHVYQVAFKETGFVHTALTVVWCFMFHSMVFFWHRFELPAVVLGYVTVDRPRMVTPPISNGGTVLGQSHQDTSASPQRQSRQRSTQSTPRIQHVTSELSSNVDLPSQPRPGTIFRSESVSSTRSPGNVGSNSRTGISNVTSHPSFSTNSSRNMGLFRNNLDDDNSTGSMLYFMGGEVVVHRGAPTSSPTVMPPQPMTREESSFSLPSAASDAVGGMLYGASGHSVGLDVSESRTGCDDDADETDDEFANVAQAASMDTVLRSNITPPATQHVPKEDCQPASTDNGHSLDCYVQESGGSLQAIFESRLTPRHRNSHQEQLPSGMLLDVSCRSNNTTSQPPYQRTPPTFPELPSSKRQK